MKKVLGDATNSRFMWPQMETLVCSKSAFPNLSGPGAEKPIHMGLPLLANKLSLKYFTQYRLVP